ncbi:Imm27 family immunity protein [Planctomicrobium piriforme]|uniref:Immunity protein 27 n=1 Tax=Planctomicrobium piriforme TaxID=1576369 RepID=A0A1I3LC73_9PLAN|nr:Imm27 family immunity protein [Planctomicrobium piriforme]SFI82086.1 Immunity protein 27 [Planctomicrobium piriforme]
MNPLQSHETVLTGQWIFENGVMRGDPTELRIEWLTESQLSFIGDTDGGWSSLYRDPQDGRYWELSYPQSYMHGGGPLELTYLTPEIAMSRYPGMIAD